MSTWSHVGLCLGYVCILSCLRYVLLGVIDGFLKESLLFLLAATLSRFTRRSLYTRGWSTGILCSTWAQLVKTVLSRSSWRRFLEVFLIVVQINLQLFLFDVGEKYCFCKVSWEIVGSQKGCVVCDVCVGGDLWLGM